MSQAASASAGPSRRRRGDPDDVDIDEREEQRQRRIRDGEEEEDEPEDPRQQWTLDTFEDVTIDEQALQQLRDISARLKALKVKLEDGLEMTKETARVIEEASPDDDLISNLEESFLANLDQKAVLDLRLAVIDDIIQKVKRPTGMNSLAEYFKTESDIKIKAYKSRSLRKRYKDDATYYEFRKGIWDVRHEDEPCPPMSRWLPRGDDDSDDSDIEMGGMTQNYRCPLTLRVFEDAAKSTVCGHYFSYNSVMDYIRSAKGGRGRGRAAKVKCPFAGCNQELTEAMIQRDPVMQRQADAFEARRRRREEEEANEESFVDME